MKSLKEYITESLLKEDSEGFTVHNLIVKYDCPADLYIQVPANYTESDIQIYMDDTLLTALPASQGLAEKFFGKNNKNIIDVYFEYDAIDIALGKEQKVDVLWDERYDNSVTDKNELSTYQIKNLKYIVEFEKFEFDNKINEDNVQETIETLFNTTVSNNVNKYPIEISLNNANIEYDEQN